MAKSKNTKKNIKKNVNKEIDKMESNVSKEILKFLRVIFAVVVVLSAFYLLTLFILGKDDTSSEELKEATIQYDEILAGSSFGMKEDKYVVCYYDYSDEELSELTSVLYNYSYNGKYRLYTVDMGNGFNKPYASENKSNTKPASASDLAIKGPTLIKFVDGKVEQYYEGVDAIIGYLK